MNHQFFEAQHRRLSQALNDNSHLEQLIFQGKPLSWYASGAGLSKLLEAVDKNWLDPIAFNHSIRRYCSNN